MASTTISGISTEPVTLIASGTLSNTQISELIQSQARRIADDLLRQQARQSQIVASGRVFTRFDIGSDIVENQTTSITAGLFSGNSATMSVIFTSSLQPSSSKSYYYEAWDGTTSTSEPQFSIAFGNVFGSGSVGVGTANDSPSRAIYSQYKLLLLNPGDTRFTFADGTTPNSIYIINFNRARIREKLDPGNWELCLAELNGGAASNDSYTGSIVQVSSSNVVRRLIDDSSLVTSDTTITTAGRVFNIVSGSLADGPRSEGISGLSYYGLVYPDMGVMVFDGAKLNSRLSFNTVSGSNVPGDNSWKLYTSISGAMALSRTNNAFQARNEETITSTHYFVRIKNGEYNFSNNPSFTTGSVGEFKQPTFINDPKTYITTVGLYNDSQELLAVAKLSQPIRKSFSDEVSIKIKLDY